MELPICRNPAVGKAQYSDLSSGYTIYVTPLKLYTVHAVYFVFKYTKLEGLVNFYREKICICG